MDPSLSSKEQVGPISYGMVDSIESAIKSSRWDHVPEESKVMGEKAISSLKKTLMANSTLNKESKDLIYQELG